MAGFLGNHFGWAGNPLYEQIASRRNAIMGFGAGFASGKNPTEGMANALKGMAAGSVKDDEFGAYQAEQATLAQEQMQRQDQINKTAAFLREKGAADLADAIDAGMIDGNTAFRAWHEQQQGQQQAPIKVGQGETLLDPNTLQPVYQGQPDQGDAFGYEKDLYAQYAAADPVKMYETVKGGYERVRQSAALKTGAGDMGLIYGYMKMLDPGSVVRETEFAMAAQAGSYGEQIQGLVSSLVNGERLPDSVREQFLQAAEGIYAETAANLESVNSQFSTRATNYGIDPSMFIRQPETYQPLNGIVTMPNGNTVRPL